MYFDVFSASEARAERGVTSVNASFFIAHESRREKVQSDSKYTFEIDTLCKFKTFLTSTESAFESVSLHL